MIHRSDAERALVEEAERLFPTGTRCATFDPDGRFVVRSAAGSRIRDVSGNEYIDYLLGSGPHLLGHAPRAVLEALPRLAAGGTSHLVVSETAIELARKIVEHVPCAEMVSFTSSGSEATLYALRLARAYRRRDKILKFEGAYHGMHDYALMSNQWTAMPPPFPRATPNSHGIPECIAGEVLVAPFNDLETTTAIIDRHRDELAGVIVEPLQRSFAPRPIFLRGLREITANLDIPLIFDEVVTGFRLGLGGAQARYGVTPDLCALGKAISGGLPLGVLCGRAELMRIANPMRRLEMQPFTMQTGTFSANPLSTGVASAVIAELEQPGTYERLERVGRQLMDGLGAALDEAGIPAVITGEPSVFQAWFSDEPVFDHRSAQRADAALGFRFADLLLAEGVLKAAEKFFVSTAHSAEDVHQTLEAFRRAAARLAQE